jgi:myo-inositol 2-dehydrogenase / D-chiro-inositol 1-dehydrogenase
MESPAKEEKKGGVMMKKNGPGRRDFLRTAGVAVMASAAPSEASPAQQAIRSSERPTVAVIGLGGRGTNLAQWQTPPFADVVAVCDVDLRKTARFAQTLAEKTGRKVETHQDYRRLLDRKDIQVIVNATCDHWHAKVTIDACRAGKDVYSEKPLGLTIDEGKMLRKVVAETGRIVQVGAQQRSGIQYQIACNLVRNGRLGKLKQVGVILPGGGFRQGRVCTADPAPKELNWDMWQGQAPVHPFCQARLAFRNWSEYGGGLVTDWGAHHMDIAHWGMGGEEVGPLSVEAQGYCSPLGKPDYPDQFVPFSARLEYPDGVELWFFSEFTEPKDADKEGLRDVVDRIYSKVPEDLRKYRMPEGGVAFVGTQGRIFVGRQSLTAEGVAELANIPPTYPIPLADSVAGLYAHMRNFVECVQTRRKPVSCVAELHRTLIPCHLTNIALRLGRKLQWDPKREEFVGDQEANARLRRTQREPYRIEA